MDNQHTKVTETAKSSPQRQQGQRRSQSSANTSTGNADTDADADESLFLRKVVAARMEHLGLAGLTNDAHSAAATDTSPLLGETDRSPPSSQRSLQRPLFDSKTGPTRLLARPSLARPSDGKTRTSRAASATSRRPCDVKSRTTRASASLGRPCAVKPRTTREAAVTNVAVVDGDMRTIRAEAEANAHQQQPSMQELEAYAAQVAELANVKGVDVVSNTTGTSDILAATETFELNEGQDDIHEARRLSIQEMHSGQIPGAYDIRPGPSGSGATLIRNAFMRELSTPYVTDATNCIHGTIANTEDGTCHTLGSESRRRQNEDASEGSPTSNTSTEDEADSRMSLSAGNPRLRLQEADESQRNLDTSGEDAAKKVVSRKNALVAFSVFLVISAVTAAVMVLVLADSDGASVISLTSSTGLATLGLTPVTPSTLSPVTTRPIPAPPMALSDQPEDSHGPSIAEGNGPAVATQDTDIGSESNTLMDDKNVDAGALPSCIADNKESESHTGYVEMRLQGLDGVGTEAPKEELEELFREVYNNVSGMCLDAYDRTLTLGSVNLTVPPPLEQQSWDAESTVTYWTADVTCNSCPDYEPLFQVNTTGSGDLSTGSSRDRWLTQQRLFDYASDFLPLFASTFGYHLRQRFGTDIDDYDDEDGISTRVTYAATKSYTGLPGTIGNQEVVNPGSPFFVVQVIGDSVIRKYDEYVSLLGGQVEAPFATPTLERITGCTVDAHGASDDSICQQAWFEDINRSDLAFCLNNTLRHYCQDLLNPLFHAFKLNPTMVPNADRIQEIFPADLSAYKAHETASDIATVGLSPSVDSAAVFSNNPSAPQGLSTAKLTLHQTITIEPLPSVERTARPTRVPVAAPSLSQTPSTSRQSAALPTLNPVLLAREVPSGSPFVGEMLSVSPSSPSRTADPTEFTPRPNPLTVTLTPKEVTTPNPTSISAPQPTPRPSLQPPTTSPKEATTPNPTSLPAPQPTSRPSLRPSAATKPTPNIGSTIAPKITTSPSIAIDGFVPSLSNTGPSIPSAGPSSMPSTLTRSQTPTILFPRSVIPSDLPSTNTVLSIGPSKDGSGVPSTSAHPSTIPSSSSQPSLLPSELHESTSLSPSTSPSQTASLQENGVPSSTPSLDLSLQPPGLPSMSSSASLSAFPSPSPSTIASSSPSMSSSPSSSPSQSPSMPPSDSQSMSLSTSPSSFPSPLPSMLPSRSPSASPNPSRLPSKSPSMRPSSSPSLSPSQSPSMLPSSTPSVTPTAQTCFATRGDVDAALVSDYTDPGGSTYLTYGPIRNWCFDAMSFSELLAGQPFNDDISVSFVSLVFLFWRHLHVGSHFQFFLMLQGWDVSKISDMSGVFRNCRFNQVSVLYAIVFFLEQPDSSKVPFFLVSICSLLTVGMFQVLQDSIGLLHKVVTSTKISM